ncbi:TIGR02530 family flagellar biosynthesis protein [Geoalkalibacter sp.]|uniref:TIGR02530 family flagellar biosynthesis protein n=1 Tax=Geoalkalibacter sp. TaxID=3041440 RepID=UPI00272E3842|nr:TIGR02530 family flagellar biosynthesis protein [Geoalkalibacter sp.]
MNDKFTLYSPPVYPVSPQPPPAARRAPGKPLGPSFDEVLRGQLKGKPELQFSRHALARMESRGISFGPAELGRIESAVQSVQAKGGRDSLVLLDGNALVVSVKNATVVTVVDQDSLRNNVFTNIDSAVIA